MNRTPSKYHLDGFVYNGAKRIVNYKIGYSDREVYLKNKTTKRQQTLSENCLREAFEKTEAYLHGLPFVHNIDTLTKRIEAGLMMHPSLKDPISADSIIWILDHLRGGETVDCRPHEIKEKLEV